MRNDTSQPGIGRHRGAALGAVLLAALGSAAAGSAATQDFSWEGRVAPGQAIEIKGINGDVDAGPASGDRVEVTAVKRGRRSDPASVQVKVVEHAGGVTLCAVYPSSEGRRPNECLPGEGGHLGANDNDVSVRFTVRVPAGVRFVGRTVNGDVAAENLSGDVQATTVNGGVRLSTAGQAEAETVNGSITASVGQASGANPLTFKTVNGSIAVELPATANADLRAATVNGDIHSDFPLHGSTRISRRSLSGTIGSGGRRLALDTVNGSIRIRQAQ
jgi:opacity protein-like surface antigen